MDEAIVLSLLTKKNRDAVIEPKEITENGVYHAPEGVDGFAPVTVNVPNPSSGSLTITENGTYDVTDKAGAVVLVQDGKYADLVRRAFTALTADDFENITGIGSYAFAGSAALTAVTIPGSVHTVGGYSFTDCPSLTNVSLLNGIVSVGNSAFSKCSALEHIVLPDSVTSIGTNAFSSCSNLLSVVLPNGITSLEPGLFSSCSKLESVVIPDSVTTIGSSCFGSCREIESLVIPANVTNIGSYAIDIGKAAARATVTMLGTTPPTVSSPFGSYVQTVIVPYSADHSVLNAYKTASGWASSASKLREAEE